MAYQIKATQHQIGHMKILDSPIVEYTWLQQTTVEYSLEKSLQCLPKEIQMNEMKQFLFDHFEIMIVLLVLFNIVFCFAIGKLFYKKAKGLENELIKKRKESSVSEASSSKEKSVEQYNNDVASIGCCSIKSNENIQTTWQQENSLNSQKHNQRCNSKSSSHKNQSPAALSEVDQKEISVSNNYSIDEEGPGDIGKENQMILYQNQRMKSETSSLEQDIIQYKLQPLRQIKERRVEIERDEERKVVKLIETQKFVSEIQESELEQFVEFKDVMKTQYIFS